jgi:thiamine pyrophosphate-dependent acetolactate synthase large subunit-like protein
MADITGSEIIARCLQKEGVEDLFYIMGGPMLLAEATCIKEGIRMIDVRHEQAAAFMCQAYSRLKQVPSVWPPPAPASPTLLPAWPTP